MSIIHLHRIVNVSLDAGIFAAADGMLIGMTFFHCLRENKGRTVYTRGNHVPFRKPALFLYSRES